MSHWIDTIAFYAAPFSGTLFWRLMDEELLPGCSIACQIFFCFASPAICRALYFLTTLEMPDLPQLCSTNEKIEEKRCLVSKGLKSKADMGLSMASQMQS